MQSIQIFACDHRKDVQWNLPYIRFGGPESECAIKTNANQIFGIDVNADETSKIFWLWENLDQFGSPDFIGYCQYRRFFAAIQTSCPLINISNSQFEKKFALDPMSQLSLITSNQADGILHPHFKVINDAIIPYKYIWEQIFILEQEKNLQLKYQRLAFDILLENTPSNLKCFMEKSFEIKENYLCNIFTTKSSIFKQFGEVAFNSVKDLLSQMSKDEQEELHPYWLAYLFERYTSCWYHALELSGKYKFLKIPLMTLDGNKHIKWEKKNA